MTTHLPLRFDLSLNMQMISRTPFTAFTSGGDLSGTGVSSSTPLPGIQYGCLAVGCSKSHLAKAVASFNANYAATKAPNGAVIPAYVLPSHYQLGDPTINQDFRLGKNFVLRERYTFAIFGEVFNAFNIANLRATAIPWTFGALIRPRRPSPSASQPNAPSRRSVPPAREPFKLAGASAF